tara:strand:+ start:6401 stop:7162 length:762 start_codon:yes stop_codon:yes gene_type:complete
MKTRKQYNNSLEYNGQAYADKFVLNCTDFKRDGYFLELGSRDAIQNNNSYILEESFGWIGIMVERESGYELEYATHRPNSLAIIEDATQIDYKKLFKDNNLPLNLDFLQLDLEVRDNTSLETFLKINSELLDDYKFAVITMEHDIYTELETAADMRIKSREILESRGYYCVFKDIVDSSPPEYISCPYEDWWVHPDLVNMKYIKYLLKKNQDKYLTVNTPTPIEGNASALHICSHCGVSGTPIKCFKAAETEY